MGINNPSEQEYGLELDVEKIESAMFDAGVTKKALAEAMQVNPHYVGIFLRNPDKLRLSQIAKVAYILTGTPYPEDFIKRVKIEHINDEESEETEVIKGREA